MDSEGLDFAVTEGGIAIVTWSNGENRTNLSTAHAWSRVLDKVESNNEIKALIVTGNGKYFCLGRDLKFLAKQDDDYNIRYTKAMQVLYKRLVTLPVPTVALINGHAFGAGALIALSCDYRIMRSDRGWLSWPEAALGIRLRGVSVGLFRSKLPEGRQQRDAILFSKRFSAKQAERLGIVDIATDEARMMTEAKTLVKDALGKSGLDRKSLARMKIDLYGKYINLTKL